jgi:hypothetical protein
MRRSWTLAALIILATCAGAPAQPPSIRADFWVAPQGTDANPGTAERPFATIRQAQNAVREQIAAGLKSDLVVMIRGGVYELGEPLVFTPEDCGTEKHSVTYRAYPDEKVVLSGGRRLSGWRSAGGGIWTAQVPGAKQEGWNSRNFYVNGRRAVHARTPNADDKNPHWQLAGAELTKDRSRFTLTLPPGLVKNWKDPGQIEVMVAGNWEINRKQLESVDEKTGSVALAPPHIPGPGYIFPSRGRWCYFAGAREFLDQPGEWHLDRASGALSYWPLPGENIEQAEAVLGVLEQLVKVAGQPGRPARNLHFRGIRLQYADWQIPAGGYQGIQAGHFATAGSHWPRITAAVLCTHAQGCSFEDGELTCLGGCGIELTDGARGNLIQGNQVCEVGSNGINVGGPNDERLVPRDNRVENNCVHACGRDDYGAVGIWVGLSQRTTVAHNLVYDLPYSGISVGWQWNPQPTACKENLVEFNHVYDVLNRLCDGGCLYTLGLQPGTVIRGNHLHDAHRSQFAQGSPNNGMFIDEGSKGFLFEQNVIYNTSAQLVRFNQCQKDWHTWRDNHFGEAAVVTQSGKDIIAKAGPLPPYRQRFEAAKR